MFTRAARAWAVLLAGLSERRAAWVVAAALLADYGLYWVFGPTLEALVAGASLYLPLVPGGALLLLAVGLVVAAGPYHRFRERQRTEPVFAANLAAK